MNKLAAVATSLVLVSVGVPEARAAGDWSWPVRGPVITAYQNGDDPYAAGQHRGIDISAPVGAPVVAAAPGTIVFAGAVGSSGLTVGERTDDGRYELTAKAKEEVEWPFGMPGRKPQTVEDMLNEMQGYASYLEDLGRSDRSKIAPFRDKIRNIAERLAALVGSGRP